jgi:hypothetical protein
VLGGHLGTHCPGLGCCAERFNLTEGAILARDLLEAACNYSKRTNSSAMKMEIARHIVAKYTVMNVRMTQGGYVSCS